MIRAELFRHLGLPAEPTLLQLTAAWRRARSSAHPDHGGDEGRFAELHSAYRLALADLSRPTVCKACDGRGRVVVLSGWSKTTLSCKACKGQGYVKPL